MDLDDSSYHLMTSKVGNSYHINMNFDYIAP